LYGNGLVGKMSRFYDCNGADSAFQDALNMGGAAMARLDLSREEWQLILELLEQERAELHCEVRHARFYDVRELLRRKREMVEGLIERIESGLTESAEAIAP